jgi:restriction system protein
VKTLDRLRLLTPTEFEEVVEIVMRRLDHTQVKRVGGSGDLCVDITAINQDGKQVAVQCKRYAAGNRITSDDMQKFIGMIYMHHRADKGIYVTTSSYTKEARRLGEANGIELIEGEELVKIIHGVAPDLA